MVGVSKLLCKLFQNSALFKLCFSHDHGFVNLLSVCLHRLLSSELCNELSVEIVTHLCSMLACSPSARVDGHRI